jgi:UDP-N-acetylglucosamine acyltransferase
MRENVAIHRTALVAPDVEIGTGTVIGPFAVVLAPCSIGSNCWIGPHVVIGTTAEDLGAMTVASIPAGTTGDPDEISAERLDELIWFGSQGSGVTIGDGTTVREHCTIQQGTDHATAIGRNVFMMSRSYVAHDVCLGDGVRFGPAASIAGHGWVGADANVGMASGVHQYRAIGAGAMIGMHATVVRDVEPFRLMKGTPARPDGVNEVGMTRLGYSESDVAALRRHYADGTPIPGVLLPHFEAWEHARS